MMEWSDFYSNYSIINQDFSENFYDFDDIDLIEYSTFFDYQNHLIREMVDYQDAR